jgi:preprotein translocase subunit SecA
MEGARGANRDTAVGKTVPGLRQRLAAAFLNAQGIGVEYDLSRHERIAASARLHDLSGWTAGDLRAEARRQGPAPGRDEVARRGHLLALAAEAARRAPGLAAFDLQLVAAAALLQGRVVEMKTGEGKTLAAALAAAVLAMSGTTVHVFTANDYLARRDAAWMGGMYGLLGLSVDWIEEGSTQAERKAAYRGDILYLSPREAGFDYLRDGLATTREEAVVGPLGAAIFDEADFVLIDEARVPLVIAGRLGDDGGPGEGQDGDGGLDPLAADAAAASLLRGRDYEVDTRMGRVSLSLAGLSRLEGILGRPEAPDGQGLARVHAALVARELLRRDVDYVVCRDGLRPVDELTGRRADKRRWPWGVQAALEVKEGLTPSGEGMILGSITVEQLAARYPLLSAMTATALAAAEDFALYYGLVTTVIPPRLPSRRTDLPDVVHRGRAASLAALADEAVAEAARGRPILIGTASIVESEEVAAALAARGVTASVLNARNDEAEAAIIARAGLVGAVTVSTNMAGRGTDIRLGGPGDGPEAEADAARAASLGGLYVIGLGRRESRRVDEQLRGRAGRQGEAGQSRFFVSLEDEFFRRYGVRDFLPPEWRRTPAAGEPDDEGPITDKRVLHELDRAQLIVSQHNRELRRSLRKFGLMLELDRRCLRAIRDAALLEGRFPEEIEAALEEAGRTLADGEAGAARRREILVPHFLGRLDRLWAAHLAFVEDLKEGAGLLRYAGLDPGREYAVRSGDAFESALAEAMAATARDATSGRALPLIPGAGVAAGTVWTYVSTEEALPPFSLLGVAPGDLGAAIARAFALAAASLLGLFRRPRGPAT